MLTIVGYLINLQQEKRIVAELLQILKWISSFEALFNGDPSTWALVKGNYKYGYVKALFLPHCYSLFTTSGSITTT